MTDVLFRALVNAVEYLVPPLHNALKWDPIEFGSIIPEYYGSSVAPAARALNDPATVRHTVSTKSSHKELDLQQREPSATAPIIAA